MSNLSLATKYRPKEFNEVVGQEMVVDILTSQLKNNYIPHTLIFEGPSGVGKTTLARIYANTINNGLGEPIEIDAASNNGVDNVRGLIKEAYDRALYGTYKVFVVDECHAISSQGWQAFLKCIEEPPKYSIFIFCTTELNKVPGTIQNRCQVLHLHRLSPSIIKDRLKYICEKEDITSYEESIEYISKIANGEMRTAISYLEKASFNKDMDIDRTVEALDRVSYYDIFNLINAVLDDREDIIFSHISRYYNNGVNFSNLTEQLINTCLDVQKYIIFGNLSLCNIPLSYEDRVKNSINFDDNSAYYLNLISKLQEFKINSKYDMNKADSLSIVLLNVARGL